MSSRQYRWQQARIAEGLCAQCGRRRIRHYTTVCDVCALAQRRRKRQRAGLSAWEHSGRGRPPLVADRAVKSRRKSRRAH